jgi:choice-of-anchor A domain-containing protein
LPCLKFLYLTLNLKKRRKEKMRNQARRLSGSLLVALLLALGLNAFISVEQASAATDIDTTPSWNGHNSVGPFGKFNNGKSAYTLGQVVTAPATDTVLTSFTFYMGQPTTIQFRGMVYEWNGSRATGPQLYESALRSTSNAAIFEAVTFNTGNLQLVAGKQYVLLATISKDFEANPNNNFVGQWGDVPSSTYPGGDFVYVNSVSDLAALTTQNWSFIGLDLAFKASFVSPVSLPHPFNYNAVSLGNLSLQSTQVQGKLAACGNASLQGTNLATTNPDADAVLVQGNVDFQSWGNQVNGNVVYSGTKASSFATFLKGSFVSKANVLACNDWANYLKNLSNFWAGKAANGTTDVKSWDQIILSGGAGVNYFNVTSSALANTNSLVINAPAGSTAIINVTGAAPYRMQYMGISLQGGIDRQHIIYNFPTATTLTVNGVAVEGSLFAPNAAVTFMNGTLNGTLMAGSLTDQNGQYNNYPSAVALPTV